MSAAVGEDRALSPTNEPMDLERRSHAAFETYMGYCAEAEAYLNAGNFNAAAAYAAIAAQSAVRPHAGFFRPVRLERLLTDIGRRTAHPTSYRRSVEKGREITTILHVCTTFAAVGGLANLLRHWIASDHTRRHSIVLTAHSGPLLPELASAIARSGGSVHKLNRTIGGYVEWAAELRRLAESYDAVVLDAYSQDVMPTIAFADPLTRPPTLLMNHGDHLMWLGGSVSDVVINLRDAAQDLSIARRGIEPDRNVMVPTIVVPPERAHSRQEAKAALGVPQDAILLFSAARAMKYRTVGGVTYAETHVDLLRRHPKALFWILGAGDQEDWRSACAAVDGRLKGLPETRETQLYFEAADIYVDSYPFVSSTSLMEAAGYGTPLVSRFYGPKEAEIFAINHPGLMSSVLNATNEDQYLQFLDRLIEDKAYREQLGVMAEKGVRDLHTPPGWLDILEVAYARAIAVDPIDTAATLAGAEAEAYAFGPVDQGLYEVFGLDDEPLLFIKPYVRLLPLGDRIALWRKLRRQGAFASRAESLRHLAPEWLINAVKDRALGSAAD